MSSGGITGLDSLREFWDMCGESQKVEPVSGLVLIQEPQKPVSSQGEKQGQTGDAQQAQAQQEIFNAGGKPGGVVVVHTKKEINNKTDTSKDTKTSESSSSSSSLSSSSSMSSSTSSSCSSNISSDLPRTFSKLSITTEDDQLDIGSKSFAHVYYERIREIQGVKDLKIHFEEAIQLNEKDGFAHAWLGNIFMMQNGDEGASRHFKRAIELNEKNGCAHAGLGALLKRQRDYKSAKTYLEKALQLNENDHTARANLANVLVMLGDDENAKVYLTELQRNGSFPEFVKSGLATIEKRARLQKPEEKKQG